MQTVDVELGVLALPDGADRDGADRDDGAHPGAVLLPDVWGLGDHARDLCGRLAGEGFAVLGVDLYRRLDEVKIEDPGAWIRGLSDPQILSDVEAAAALLAAHPAVGHRKVGVIGFCMGGTYALLAACGTPGIAAAVPFYGMLSHEHGLLHDPTGLDRERKPRQPLDAAAELRCPLLAFFGADDPYIPLDDVAELERRLEKVEMASELVVVQGAGHAFMNDTRPDAYRPDAAGDAWQRMIGFLRKHL